MYSSKTRAEAISKSTGCKETYCFMKLPNHNRMRQVFPDAMHTVKDCVEKMFFLLIGKVNLDTITASEASLGRCSLKKKRRIADDQPLPYVLSTEEMKLADKRAKAILSTNGDFNPGTIFFRTTSLKLHDWKEVHLMHKDN